MSQSDSPHPPGALASMLGEPLVARLAHVSRRAGPGVVGSTGLWRLQQEPLSGLPKSRAPKCGQRLGGSRIGVLEGKTWHWPGRKKAMEWPSGTHVQGRVALVKAGVDQAPGSPSHKRKQQGPVGGSRNPELHTHTHTHADATHRDAPLWCHPITRCLGQRPWRGAACSTLPTFPLVTSIAQSVG